MREKSGIDDLASLFLPDLLNPLANTNDILRLEMEEDIYPFPQEHSFSAPNPPVYKFFGPQHTANPPDMGFAQINDHLMMNQMMPFPGNNVAYNNNTYNQVRGFSPYPDIDFGHFPHHTDFVAAEPDLQQQFRQRQPHLVPLPGPNPASYETPAWPQEQTRPPVQEIAQSGRTEPKKEVKKETDSKVVRHNPQITVDFSAEPMIKLLDLKRVSSTPGIELGGFLRGRLLTNNEDNYKYLTVTAGSVDPSLTYAPLVISCYRRNYINLYLRCSIELSKVPQYDGESAQKFRLVISAQTDSPEPAPVAFSTITDSKQKKDLGKIGDNLPIQMIEPDHTIELSECDQEHYFMVKKLKFTSATANSTNFSFQTYNQLCVRLYAEYPSASQLMSEFKSSSLVVRGRNPSFYQSKNDHLIKPRTPQYSASFEASSGVPEKDEESLGKEVEKARIQQSKELSTDLNTGIKQEDSNPNLEQGSSHSNGNLDIQEPDPFDMGITPKPEMASDQNEEDEDDSEKERDGSESGDEDSTRESQENMHKSKNDLPSVSALNETDLKTILKNMSKGDESYHYFPILSVYYLPPINVVYFPHGAHHTQPPEDVNEQARKDPDSIASPLSQSQGERKNSSKVYFR